MENSVEHQIRELAQPLWESAARPYGMALDFWLMAEQMVLEMMAATARVSGRATGADGVHSYWEMPEAAPVTRIRELAELMWEAAGRQYGMAQDFWLAAERHILAMMRAASGTDGASRRYYQELASLPPSAYMERIRIAAYYMWESAGRQYGQALDFWLAAEQKTLETLAGAASLAGYPGVQQSLPAVPEPATEAGAAVSAPGAPSADTVVAPDAATENRATPAATPHDAAAVTNGIEAPAAAATKKHAPRRRRTAATP